ncbi:glutathione S-transferase [Pararhodobacter aggregans]|nr:glutathione S-transferase [Pararhodobacter aggregans]
MMTLHQSPTSPYVRKVMVLLHEAGALDSVRLSFASGSPVDPGSIPLGANPLGKIPALERDDGCTLYDSRVICRYLATTTPKAAALYPEGPALWETLTLEATGDGILDAALLMRYETVIRPAEGQSEAWVDGQWQKIARSLTALESRWMAHLQGPLTMGSIAVACALGYLDFRHDARGWRNGHPQLAAWYEAFAKRPSMQATIPA